MEEEIQSQNTSINEKLLQKSQRQRRARLILSILGFIEISIN